ncbi:hypothetical protein PAHAL_5G136800 [Panicum hallii]|uniref:Uncharacterized protein n=1 Tax=Panicum hallii TaxID=206008 RepID=A0A2T8IJW7_9POAL|nr:hypothetical protein PAHAL_5G136800 [Panicum hallii]
MTPRSRGKRGRTSPDSPAKRRRGGPPEREADDYPEPAGQQPSSGLEAYGPIARARVDAAAATGYVTFRSGAAAVAAIAASLDPDGGITIGSNKVLVVQASEAAKNSKSIVRAADPAGRSSHDATKNNANDDLAAPGSKAAGVTCRAREIVAYDDLF